MLDDKIKERQELNKEKLIGTLWVSMLTGTEIEIASIDDLSNFYFWHGRAKQTKCCLSNIEFFRIYKQVKDNDEKK